MILKLIAWNFFVCQIHFKTDVADQEANYELGKFLTISVLNIKLLKLLVFVINFWCKLIGQGILIDVTQLKKTQWVIQEKYPLSLVN